MISKASKDEKLPVYGNGLNVRDWIHVYDHNVGVDMIVRNGKIGETYNLGGHAEKANIEIVKTILSQLDKPEELITYVKELFIIGRSFSLRTCSLLQSGQEGIYN